LTAIDVQERDHACETGSNNSPELGGRSITIRSLANYFLFAWRDVRGRVKKVLKFTNKIGLR